MVTQQRGLERRQPAFVCQAGSYVALELMSSLDHFSRHPTAGHHLPSFPFQSHLTPTKTQYWALYSRAPKSSMAFGPQGVSKLPNRASRLSVS